MTKKVYIYAFLVILVVVLALTTFYYSLYVCNEFYTGDVSDTEEIAADPQNMCILPDGNMLIYGMYDYGTSQNRSYYKVYSKEGNVLAYSTLGESGRAVEITGITAHEDGFVFSCIDENLEDFRDVSGRLYFVNYDYELEKTIPLAAPEEDILYNVIPVDSDDSLYACVSNFCVYIFTEDGSLETTLPLTNVAKVLCVSKGGDTFVIGGTLAMDELLDSFKDSFIAGYDSQGTMLWQNVYCEKENTISTIASLKHTGNGNFTAYGRYIDYSKNIEEGDTLTEMSIDEFYRLTYYGNHTDFQVITPDGVIDYTLQASVFLQNVDKDGNNTEAVEFNAFDDYAVPMPLNILFEDETQFIAMTTYTLTSYKSQRYNINIDLYDENLDIIESIRLTPNQRTKILFTMDNEKNIYTYHSLGGKTDVVVRLFDDSTVLANKLAEVELMLTVRDGFIKVYEIIDWIFIAVLVFFSVLIKTRRRFDK